MGIHVELFRWDDVPDQQLKKELTYGDEEFVLVCREIEGGGITLRIKNPNDLYLISNSSGGVKGLIDQAIEILQSGGLSQGLRHDHHVLPDGRIVIVLRHS